MFIALVVLLYCTLIATLKRPWQTGVVLGLWLIVTGLGAARGLFMDFTSLPPHLALVIVPALVATFFFGFGPPLRTALPLISGRQLVVLQSFRVAVELLLWSLASQQLLPELMTFNGRNFDILTGLTAPFIAWYCFRKGASSSTLLIVWNLAGLALVTNVFAHGMLAAPTRFQYFFTTPANEIIGTFPYVWLPGFLVPTAYFLHFISLRKALAARAAR